jgi:exopolyphosphatase/guanosine-5'-triphosphate,3'-diphosphate pyrophosphatase
MEIACLDLGSNTFHLQHLRVSDAGFETVLDRKHAVRLGDAVSRTGGIDGRGWREGHAAVEDLLAASRARRPDQLTAVATSAIRRAGNGGKFLDELRRRFESLAGLAVVPRDPRDDGRNHQQQQDSRQPFLHGYE